MGYWKNFLGVFWAGLMKSTRQQVIGALLAISVVIYQFHYGLVTEAHVRGAYWSVAWPYVIMVAAFVLWHLIKTPVEIDATIAGELTASRRREESLAAKLKEIEDVKPCIIVRDVYTEKVGVNQNGLQVCTANVLRVKLENAPPHPHPNGEAKNVTAVISFYDHLGTLLIAEMDARWTASAQPVGPHTGSTVALLGMDLGIGVKRDLDIAFAATTPYNGPTPDLVALNNDNFRFTCWTKPDRVLHGERFVAEVHVRAVWVDTKFSVEFWTLPHGEIEFRRL